MLIITQEASVQCNATSRYDTQWKYETKVTLF